MMLPELVLGSKVLVHTSSSLCTRCSHQECAEILLNPQVLDHSFMSIAVQQGCVGQPAMRRDARCGNRCRCRFHPLRFTNCNFGIVRIVLYHRNDAQESIGAHGNK